MSDDCRESSATAANQRRHSGDYIACGSEGELTGKIERYGAASMRIRRASWYHEITTIDIAPI